MKGQGSCVLYLDFDGVLHHENCYWHPRRGAYLRAPARYRLFEHVELLEELMRPYPEIRIVLSTSWVVRLGYSRTAKRLPPSLRERVIGATLHTRMNEHEFHSHPRGMQVWLDVTRRKPAQWLALDDTWEDWPLWCLENYVRTDPDEGIGAPEVTASIVEKLKQLGNPS